MKTHIFQICFLKSENYRKLLHRLQKVEKTILLQDT